jgi:AbrB family looped-hinge helix DNA binding protein
MSGENTSKNTSKVGKRGTVVIPSKLRKRFGIEEGSYVMAEEREDGILIRPAVVTPVEMYSPERVAEFLLSNSVDAEDYARNVEEVRRLGLDPGKIDHVPLPRA